jgi:hypothetical protein
MPEIGPLYGLSKPLTGKQTSFVGYILSPYRLVRHMTYKGRGRTAGNCSSCPEAVPFQKKMIQ